MTSSHLRLVHLPEEAEPDELCPACGQYPFVPAERDMELALEQLAEHLARDWTHEQKVRAAEFAVSHVFQRRSGLCGDVACKAKAIGAVAVLLAARRLAEAANG